MQKKNNKFLYNNKSRIGSLFAKEKTKCLQLSLPPHGDAICASKLHSRGECFYTPFVRAPPTSTGVGGSEAPKCQYVHNAVCRRRFQVYTYSLPPLGGRREQPPPLSPVAQPTSLFSHWTRPDKSVRASSSTPPPPTSYGEHATWKRCGIRHFHAELYRDRQFSHLAGCNISTFAQNSVEFHTSSPQTHRHSHPPSSVVSSGGGRGYHVTNCSPAVTALDGGGGGGEMTQAATSLE